MTNKLMADPEYAAAVHESIANLAAAPDSDDPDQALADAGAFVARFGSIGDLYDGEIQYLMDRMMAGSPLDLLGHWSARRCDPAPQPPDDYETQHRPRCETCRYLEGVYGLYTQFEYELCGDCGLDLDGHDIGVMGGGMGMVLAMCREPWTRVEPAAVVGAWNPGRGQREEAWEARWVAALADDTYAIVFRTYYLAQTGNRVYIEQETTYVVSETPDDQTLEGWLRSTSVYAEVDADDPESADVKELAEQAPDPVRGEWARFGPESAEFLLTRLNGGTS